MFIQAAIESAQESSAVPEGTYDLRVQSVDDHEKNGKKSLKVMILVEDAAYPNAAPINMYLGLPNADDEPRTASFKLLQLRRFLVAFDIPHEGTGFDSDDFVGATASLAVKARQVEKDREGNPLADPYTTNDIVLPRLASEEAGEETPRKASGRRR